MKCDSCAKEYKYTEAGAESMSYTGNFSVVSSTDEAVLVIKKYYDTCSKTHCSGYVYYDSLELIPIDSIETSLQL